MKVELSLQQAVEAHRGVRIRRMHILHTIDSQGEYAENCYNRNLTNTKKARNQKYARGQEEGCDTFLRNVGGLTTKYNPEAHTIHAFCAGWEQSFVGFVASTI
jgi:hypothetical protein